MSLGRLKAVGERGSWFAKVGNERLPCVHAHWVQGQHHVDPGYTDSDPRWIELVAAIKDRKRVILTNDVVKSVPDKKSGMGFDRAGYIGLFAVDQVEADEHGLRFNLTERISELR